VEGRQEIEKSAGTVEEAIQEACLELGASRDDVEIEVLSQGTRGILGIGGQVARVRVIRKEGAAPKAQGFLRGLIRSLGMAGEVRVWEKDNDVEVKIYGDDSAILIGRHGRTLNAIQLLTEIATNKGSNRRVRVRVDIEDYKERRAAKLADFARKMADKAVKEKREIVLRPMNALERKVIHNALNEDPRVTTESIGEEPNRKVTIRPTNKGRTTGPEAQ
jgi:spoIIIJ-associated protein